MKDTFLISKIAILSGIVSIAALLLLHILSSNIDPTWHMVSEYAYGSYGSVLSVFFFGWAVCYWATALTLLPIAKNWLSRICIFLLLLSGFGALMGGLFDVRHPLHGLAFALGVPFLPIAAPYLTRYLRRQYKLSNKVTTLCAQATWISFILMAVTMAMFISQMMAAGAMNMETPQYISELPKGVTPIIGVTNRFFVFAYIGWLIAVNYMIINTKMKSKNV